MPTIENWEFERYDFNESRILCELALVVVGRPPCSRSFCQTFATVYTTPDTKPTKMALKLGSVTGVSKKINPLSAMGNLLSAPTME